MGAKDRRCGRDEMALLFFGFLVMALDLKLKKDGMRNLDEG